MNALAADEFAFRLLGEQEGDAAEPACQYRARPSLAAPVALDGLLRQLVLGTFDGGSAIERVLAVLLQVHLPATVTPFAGYGVHASYPSPRAYYPLRFALHDRVAGARWQVDMDRVCLVLDDGHDGSAGTRFTITIQADFTVYAPLYRLFRAALFALEAGHFLSEFIHLGAQCGLQVALRVAADALYLDIDAGAEENRHASAFARHMAFARDRNSGRFVRGFFPAPCAFGPVQLDRLVRAIDAALAATRACCGERRLAVRLCLPTGVYRCGADGLALLAPCDAIAACERLYNYTNFNFRHVPAIAFFCVDALAFHGTDLTYLDMNIALGFASQQLIRALHGEQLIGRPFRSYDQRGIDRLLHAEADGLRTYYGLLVAKNRSEDALGVLR